MGCKNYNDYHPTEESKENLIFNNHIPSVICKLNMNNQLCNIKFKYSIIILCMQLRFAINYYQHKIRNWRSLHIKMKNVSVCLKHPSKIETKMIALTSTVTEVAIYWFLSSDTKYSTYIMSFHIMKQEESALLTYGNIIHIVKWFVLSFKTSRWRWELNLVLLESKGSVFTHYTSTSQLLRHRDTLEGFGRRYLSLNYKIMPWKWNVKYYRLLNNELV